jgi:CrcB protein
MLESLHLSLSLDNRRRAAVAAGGAFGAIGRALVIEVVGYSGVSTLWGTLTVNLVGSLLLGFLVGWHAGRARSSPYLVPFVGIGMFGAFTTFSLFSTEVFGLFRTGDGLLAFVYAAASIVFGFLLAFAGMRLGRAS